MRLSMADQLPTCSIIVNHAYKILFSKKGQVLMIINKRCLTFFIVPPRELDATPAWIMSMGLLGIVGALIIKTGSSVNYDDI